MGFVCVYVCVWYGILEGGDSEYELKSASANFD